MKPIKISTKNREVLLFEGDFPSIKETGKRVSHIYPQNFVLKTIFKILRIIFGDKGKIAEWTRSWNVTWEVHILITGKKYKGFKNRKEAIYFEKILIKKLW